MATQPTSWRDSYRAMSSDNVKGLVLAISSSLFIGASFIVKKKGLKKAGATGVRAGVGGYSYLYEPLWWVGMITMIVGEIANFAAYAFAPAILVTPLGALSIIISAVLAHIILREKLHIFGVLGCVLCVVGSTTIVLHAPQERQIESVREVWDLAMEPAFLWYAALVITAVFVLIFQFMPQYGHTHIMVYIGVCSLVGSLSVMSVKALGIALKLTLSGMNQLIYPQTWAFTAVVIMCVLTQMNYLNKALDTFNTAVVSPIYYVMFTSLTILASIIMFKDWDRQSPTQVVTEMCGFVTILSGTFLLHKTKDMADGIIFVFTEIFILSIIVQQVPFPFDSLSMQKGIVLMVLKASLLDGRTPLDHHDMCFRAFSAISTNLPNGKRPSQTPNYAHNFVLRPQKRWKLEERPLSVSLSGSGLRSVPNGVDQVSQSKIDGSVAALASGFQRGLSSSSRSRSLPQVKKAFDTYWSMFSIKWFPFLRKVTWFYPLYVFSIILSTMWYNDIANYGFVATGSSGPAKSEFLKQNESLTVKDVGRTERPAGLGGVMIGIGEQLYSLLLLGFFFVEVYVTGFVPYIGKTVNFLLLSWMYAYYCFEYKWNLSEVSLDRRLDFFESNWAFFAGFGSPCVLPVLFSSPLVSYGIMAILYPLFVLTATDSAAEQVISSQRRKWGSTGLGRLPIFHLADTLSLKVLSLVPLEPPQEKLQDSKTL
ncbi:hypothetical protein FNV43_RR03054 [Rhamnella rubrinervis]|uniref:Magnesium transporter n=1 Tax=Rhamnella rubrinervis TaxID=2594499 RepID=A0A8K0HHN2_9ROSA|nr:hypothetical protein FNV43_RR03054 [Rhamnella rubrinervis]